MAVRVLPCQPDWEECRFEIVRGQQADLESKCTPDQGTVRRGSGISPWSGDPIPGDYIKQMAQDGRMGAQLYAIEVAGIGWREFRTAPTEEVEAARRAEAALKEHWNAWLTRGLVPVEEILTGHKTDEPRRYGMYYWHKLFAPRQLLALVTYLEVLRELAPQMEKELGRERAAAVRTYLGLVLDKCADYNCSLATWESTREIVKHWAQRHDFSLKWSFGEMNMALKDRGAFPWALEQVIDAYKGLCNLLKPSRPLFGASSPLVGEDKGGGEHPHPGLPPSRGKEKSPFGKGGFRGISPGQGEGKTVTIAQANAAALSHIPDGSIDAVIVDPPYGNNVMYAELSDFFYVWLKRSVGDLYPDWFRAELTDKHTETVANPARFRGVKGRDSREQATRDYLLKMRRAFREMRRVVKPEGAMVVMFTHREAEMWNALGLALLETGWEIGSSWPVHTESEHSLHQARKNAARSTILLFCRPRPESFVPSYWDQELRQQVRAAARNSALEYQKAGIEGVDLYLATYGPALGVLSRHWPILSAEVDRDTGEQKRLEPEEALSIARREVFAMRKEQLVQGRTAAWDPVTEWYILAWDAIKAREFSFDEARKLAISSGIDASELIQRDRILGRKGDTVSFLLPRERLNRERVNPEAHSFIRLVDALHTALYLYDTDGDRACRRFLERTSLIQDNDFRALLEAALRAIPRTRKYDEGKPTGFLLPEMETLERMRVSLFPDVAPPQESANPDAGAEQGSFESLDGDDNEE